MRCCVVCMKLQRVFSSVSSQKVGLNVDVTYRSQVIVSRSNTVRIVLLAHRSHTAHRFAHHVMEPYEWSVDVLQCCSDCSGRSYNHRDETVPSHRKTRGLDMPLHCALIAGAMFSNLFLLLHLDAEIGEPQLLCTVLVKQFCCSVCSRFWYPLL
jgi:hypothetical protein